MKKVTESPAVMMAFRCPKALREKMRARHKQEKKSDRSATFTRTIIGALERGLK